MEVGVAVALPEGVTVPDGVVVLTGVVEPAVGLGTLADVSVGGGESNVGLSVGSTSWVGVEVGISIVGS